MYQTINGESVIFYPEDILKYVRKEGNTIITLNNGTEITIKGEYAMAISLHGTKYFMPVTEIDASERLGIRIFRAFLIAIVILLCIVIGIYLLHR